MRTVTDHRDYPPRHRTLRGRFLPGVCGRVLRRRRDGRRDGRGLPDPYAAVGVHSGLPCAAASDLASAFTAMKQAPHTRPAAHPVPLIVLHGGRDAIVVPANAVRLIDHAPVAGSPGAVPTAVTTGGQVPGGHAYTRTCYQNPTGATLAERWIIHQAGHVWSGGVPHGSYTDPRGPNASTEFIRFFDTHSRGPRSAR